MGFLGSGVFLMGFFRGGNGIRLPPEEYPFRREKYVKGLGENDDLTLRKRLFRGKRWKC